MFVKITEKYCKIQNNRHFLGLDTYMDVMSYIINDTNQLYAGTLIMFTSIQ